LLLGNENFSHFSCQIFTVVIVNLVDYIKQQCLLYHNKLKLQLQLATLLLSYNYHHILLHK